MNAIAAYGLLGHGLIFGALAALLPLGEFRSRAVLAATAVAMIAGIAPVMHGFFGTPSLTLMQLVLLAHAGKSPSPLNQHAAVGITGFAGIFYLASLGFGPFDPYALGFQPAALLAALVPVGAALWWRRQDAWLAILAIDVIGYAAGLFANLWDALLDPLLVLIALMLAARQAAIRFIASRRR